MPGSRQRRSGTVWSMIIAGILLADPAGAATPLRRFPVRLGDVLLAPPLALDIDADGRQELAVASRKKLYVLEADGNPATGFPLPLEQFGWLATPLAGGQLHIEGGARQVLVFGGESGKLVVLEGGGKVAAGFPLDFKGALAGAPVLADANDDGRNELVFATREGQVWLVGGDGRALPGYPTGCGCEASTPVTVGRLKPGGKKLLVFGDSQGRLHAWEAAGREAAGFPFASGFAIYSQPVLGDLDDDGSFEVLFGSEDFKIYAVRADGKIQAGFPAATGYRIYSTPALADLDGDGVIEVIATSGDGSLYVFGREGKALAGFPQKIGNRLQSSPVAGDVDGDGRPEIAASGDDGRLWLLKADGKKYAGFPVQPADAAGLSPLLVDLDGDGVVEVVSANHDGTVSAYSLLRRGRTVLGLCWPAEARDSARSGHTHPNPARYTDLALEPREPRTTDALKLSYRHFDMDGDAEPATLIRWFRDGKAVKDLDGSRQVPAESTRKHQRWWFTLQAGKNEPVFRSPEAVIQNTAPEAPQIELQPAEPTCRDGLELKIARESFDADGDKVSYQIVWLRDRMPEKDLTGRKVPAKKLKKLQRWTAVITPSDGEASGPPARAVATVKNTPAPAAKARLEPARPAVTDRVRLVVEQPALDPDGDEVSYRIEWSAAGAALNVSASSSELPAHMALKHQPLLARVVSFDGTEPGGATVAEVKLVNTPPRPPVIRLEPQEPKVGEPLAVQIVSPAQDADGDAVSYQARWSRDGKPAGDVSGFVVPASHLRKGARWKATVVASDGEAESGPVSAEARVANTTPVAPCLEAVNPRPPTNEELAVKTIAPAADADGDRITLQAVWFEQDTAGMRELARDSKIAPLPAARTRRHGVYLLQVTASDGAAAGPPAQVWFEVANTPPSGCRAEILPAQPQGGQALEAKVQPLQDADGDRVEVALRWYRDGQPVEMGGDPHLVQAGLVNKGQRWLLVGRPHDGEEAGPECQASVVIGNRPPSPPQLVLSPETPTRASGLELRFLRPASDPDGDRLQVQWKWTADGREIPALAGAEKVGADFLRRGQKWSVQVVVSDGQAETPPAKAEVIVANSRPGKPALGIVPEKPLSSDDLRCVLLDPAADADLDALEYRYRWHRVADAGPGEEVHQGPVLPSAKTKRDERWLCRAAAWDGLEEGPAAEATLSIGNAAPGPLEVVIEPDQPKSGDELRCLVRKAAQDKDGDPVKYRFSWFKDGVLQQFAAETERVPARLTSANDIWQCTAVATDGRMDGPPGESGEVVVK